MAKFIVTCSERWSVSYLVEAENPNAAWETELAQASECSREIVANEVATVTEDTSTKGNGNGH